MGGAIRAGKVIAEVGLLLAGLISFRPFFVEEYRDEVRRGGRTLFAVSAPIPATSLSVTPCDGVAGFFVRINRAVPLVSTCSYWK